MDGFQLPPEPNPEEVLLREEVEKLGAGVAGVKDELAGLDDAIAGLQQTIRDQAANSGAGSTKEHLGGIDQRVASQVSAPLDGIKQKAEAAQLEGMKLDLSRMVGAKAFGLTPSVLNRMAPDGIRDMHRQFFPGGVNPQADPKTNPADRTAPRREPAERTAPAAGTDRDNPKPVVMADRAATDQQTPPPIPTAAGADRERATPLIPVGPGKLITPDGTDPAEQLLAMQRKQGPAPAPESAKGSTREVLEQIAANTAAPPKEATGVSGEKSAAKDSKNAAPAVAMPPVPLIVPGGQVDQSATLAALLSIDERLGQLVTAAVKDGLERPKEKSHTDPTKTTLQQLISEKIDKQSTTGGRLWRDFAAPKLFNTGIGRTASRFYESVRPYWSSREFDVKPFTPGADNGEAGSADPKQTNKGKAKSKKATTIDLSDLISGTPATSTAAGGSAEGAAVRAIAGAGARAATAAGGGSGAAVATAGGAGAAGAGAAGAGGVAAVAAGPIGLLAAVGAAAAAALYAVSEAGFQLANAQESNARKLAEFSPSQAANITELDVGRAQRATQRGEATAASGHRLTSAMDRFERATAPLETLGDTLKNTIGAAFIGTMASIAEGVSQILEGIRELAPKFDKMLKELEGDDGHLENFGEFAAKVTREAATKDAEARAEIDRLHGLWRR